MSEKQRALEMALGQIEKQFGKGSIMKLGQSTAKLNIDVISTGCLAMDMALGVGGVPRGRIVEVYGPESSGKTTVALHIIAEAQKMEEPRHLLMQSMLWTLCMQEIWALILITY